MKKKTIFSEDIELPRIVREKAGSAFSAIQTERSPMMTHQTNQEFPMQANKPHRSQARRVLAKRLAAAAACAALILAFGSLAKPLKKIQTAPSTAEQIDRLFTLQVKAAGMEEGNPIPLQEGCPFPMIAGSGKAASWVLGADDAEGSTVDYCIHIPQLTCEGEGIQSITYSINQGAFQIVQPRDAKSIIIDGQPYGKDLNTGSIGGKYEDAADAKATQNNTENSANAQESAPWQDDPYERVLYKSFTVDYSQQSDENTWINFCYVRPDSSEIIQLLWK